THLGDLESILPSTNPNSCITMSKWTMVSTGCKSNWESSDSSDRKKKENKIHTQKTHKRVRVGVITPSDDGLNSLDNSHKDQEDQENVPKKRQKLDLTRPRRTVVLPRRFRTD